MTHEQYIQRVRDAVLSRVQDVQTRERLAAVKLVYGTGAGTGARGVTYFRTWNGGNDTLDVLEVCAFGESSTVQLAGTTVHELAHAMAGVEAGHGPQWKAWCARLGLAHAEAAGQSYVWEHFADDVRAALEALPPPSDGTPIPPTRPVVPGVRVSKHGARPCPLGIGTRGGRSRGPGSGSRLRLWVCACGVKARVASDDFRAKCERCGTAFAKATK